MKLIIDVSGQNVDTLNQYLLFDHLLKEKSEIKNTEKAKRAYFFQKNKLEWVQGICFFIYLFAVPFGQAPYWCVDE